MAERAQDRTWRADRARHLEHRGTLRRGPAIRAAAVTRSLLATLPLPIIWLLARLPLIILALALSSQADATYLRYGQAIVAGELPYRDFGVEYPPLALVFLALPALAAHALASLSANSYALLFGVQALILDALFTAVLARGAGRQAVLWYLFLSLVGGSLLQTFDLLPSALTATAVVLRQRGRSRSAWLVLAVAAASKGWPLVICPLFLALDLARPRRLIANVALAAALFAALIAPGLLGGLTRAEQGLLFHAQREPEVETVYANLAMVAHNAFGVAARVYTGGAAGVPAAHSSNVASALAGWAQLPHVILAALLVLGYLCALPRLRAGDMALPGSAALLVGLFILGFSVLETQYLLWLTPLVALTLARAAPLDSLRYRPSGAGLLCAAALLLFAVLSHLLRFQWTGLLAMRSGAVAIAIARNACLIVALIALGRCLTVAAEPQIARRYRRIA